MKKVLLVNGSPHKNGNTATALKLMENELQARGLETVWFQLDGKPVRGCIACGRCASEHRCAFGDDQCNELIGKLLKADAVVIGTPVYFAGPNGALCALLDRAFYAAANYSSAERHTCSSPMKSAWESGRRTARSTATSPRPTLSYSVMPMVSAPSS